MSFAAYRAPFVGVAIIHFLIGVFGVRIIDINDG